jgi:hypothetical protein
LVALCSTVALATTGFMLATAVSSADDPPPPPLHHIKYTVTTEQPYYAEIYYRDTDPPDFAAYSHNPYIFSPNVEADVGPNQPWVLEAWLADPYHWAMVTATSGLDPITPNFHCELAVDGAVVATGQGPKGALCSIRHY